MATATTLPARKRSIKAPVDHHRSSQGTDAGLSSGDSNPLLGRQPSSPSSAGTLKEHRGSSYCRQEEPKPRLHSQDFRAIEKQLTLRLNGADKSSGGWSRTSSPRTPRSKTGRGSSDAGANAPTLPPYIRATIAEQLAPLCTRPARENTQETLFGVAGPPPSSPRPAVSRRSREDTQATLFGDSDPSAVRRSTRPVADTQNNLFGPPPEIRRRQGVRFQTDTPGILRHDETRPSPSSTADARYVGRHQDTHEKLFGSPARQPCPQVQKPLSNIFYSDSKASNKDKVVRSLPMSSLIADE